MILTSVYGWTLERIAYRPLRGSPRLAALITAIGMSIFLQNYVQLLQGARNKPIQPVVRGGFELTKTQTPAGTEFVVNLSYLQILIMILFAFFIVLFTIVITRTALGRAQRACEQDMGMAALLASTSIERYR